MTAACTVVNPGTHVGDPCGCSTTRHSQSSSKGYKHHNREYASTCISWDKHDRLFQARNGLQKLQLVSLLHGVGDAIWVDDIAVQALGL